jgi:catechol 2,3-dioxygenase-like lactoylglutathione lyase family enzyme
VELRVKDLAASRKFYADLFGFVPAEGYGYSDGRLVLISPLLAHGYRCIVLTRDPRAANADGVMLELETRAELLDRYILARLLNIQTSPLVSRGRNLLVSVHDPDGHRIDLRASHAHEHHGEPSSDGVSTRWGRDQAWTNSSIRFGRQERRTSPDAPSGDDRFSWFDALCDGEPPAH